MLEEALRLLVASIVGGGAVGGVLLAALETRMRRVFAPREVMLTGDGDLRLAKKSDLNALGERVRGLETVTIQARDSADEAHAQINQIRIEQKMHNARNAEKLDEATDRLNNLVSRLETTTASVIRLEERMRSRGEA